jgi:aminoglycoside phosphotransferase family enzyme/predicted kinase
MTIASNNGRNHSITTEQLVQELLRTDAYPHPVDDVGFLQTHISWIFFAAEYVYKVKKPVDLGFLDFTSLEKRRHFCEEELHLNRRMAPDVYLDVVAITLDSDGRLRVEGQGEVVEWAVKMRRLPDHRMFSKLLTCGEIDNSQMNSMAELLAQFHAKSVTGAGVNEHGTPAAIKANIDENFEQLEQLLDETEKPTERILTTAQHTFLKRQAHEFLANNHSLLENRVREHRIRDGHGDLHAGNICLEPNGIVAYDCIEFSPKFRCGDVASDLAFLAMDLDYRGFPAFSQYLVRRYAKLTDDPKLPELIDFYKTYRALIRGKVAALTASGTNIPPADREQARLEAMRYLQLGLAYHLPPTMVLMCGLPACGKSWLAKRLAKSMRAVVLRTDLRRKQLIGIEGKRHVHEPYESGLYSSQTKRGVYRSIRTDALKYLNAGHSVIVDATFSRRDFRSAFIESAVQSGLPYFVVHVTAPEEVIRERLAQRITAVDDPSDADLQVYLSEHKSFESPSEVLDLYRVETVSGDWPSEETASIVFDALIAAQE